MNYLIKENDELRSKVSNLEYEIMVRKINAMKFERGIQDVIEEIPPKIR